MYVRIDLTQEIKSTDQVAAFLVAAMSNGTTASWQTQVLMAVKTLEQYEGPVRLEELAEVSNMPGILYNEQVREAFLHKHPRVIYNAKANVVTFKPDYDIRSADDLLKLLRNHCEEGGLPVRRLRESWSGVSGAIDQLEKQGKIIVYRASKSGDREGFAKAVYYDESLSDVKMNVDPQFKQMWMSLKTATIDDVEHGLKQAGFNLVSSKPQIQPKIVPKNKPKRKRAVF